MNLPLKLAPFAVLAALPTICLAAPTPKQGRPQWHYSFLEARELAKASNKPIFMDFYTSWCGPCQLLDKKTYPHPVFLREAKNWILLKVDADRSPNFALKYDVANFPCVVMTDKMGKAPRLITGYWKAPTIVHEMHVSLNFWKNPPKFKATPPAVPKVQPTPAAAATPQ